MRLSPQTVMRLVVAMVVFGTITAAVAVQPDWFGENASVQRDAIDYLFNVMIVLSSYVFAVVAVLALYAVWKYRAKPGDESDGEPIHGNSRLEFAWTAIPTVIVLFAAGYSLTVLNDIEAKPSGPGQKMEITAQQFAWRFDYVEAGKTSTELHVPVGTTLDIEAHALDVLHSFWVPEWGIKRDLVPQGPGSDEVDDTFVVTPDEIGTYSVVCTEYCGVAHGSMRAVAVVETQQEFDAWLAEQKDIPGGENDVSTGLAGGSGAGTLAE